MSEQLWTDDVVCRINSSSLLRYIPFGKQQANFRSFSAIRVPFGQEVAVKIHLAEDDADGRKRFIHEAALLKLIKHRSIPLFVGVSTLPQNTQEVDETRGGPVPAIITREPRRKESLYAFLLRGRKKGSKSESWRHYEDVLNVLIDVAAALSHLHTRYPAVLHREVTARNMLVKFTDSGPVHGLLTNLHNAMIVSEDGRKMPRLEMNALYEGAVHNEQLLTPEIFVKTMSHSMRASTELENRFPQIPELSENMTRVIKNPENKKAPGVTSSSSQQKSSWPTVMPVSNGGQKSSTKAGTRPQPRHPVDSTAKGPETQRQVKSQKAAPSEVKGKRRSSKGTATKPAPSSPSTPSTTSTRASRDFDSDHSVRPRCRKAPRTCEITEEPITHRVDLELNPSPPGPAFKSHMSTASLPKNNPRTTTRCSLEDTKAHDSFNSQKYEQNEKKESGRSEVQPPFSFVGDSVRDGERVQQYSKTEVRKVEIEDVELKKIMGEGNLAPEVVDGKPYGPASDVFCFGLVLASALAHTAPIARPHRTNHYTFRFEEDVPKEVQSLIIDCCALESKTRPSMDEVRRRLIVIKDSVPRTPKPKNRWKSMPCFTSQS